MSLLGLTYAKGEGRKIFGLGAEVSCFFCIFASAFYIFIFIMEFKVNTIEEAIEDFREGKFVIVVDDEDRENEGDFIMAAVIFSEERPRRVVCPDYRGALPRVAAGYAGA